MGERGDDNDTFAPEAYEEVAALLTEIGEDCLFDMFGDHCKVIAKKDKIIVEGYTSHD